MFVLRPLPERRSPLAASSSCWQNWSIKEDPDFKKGSFKPLPHLCQATPLDPVTLAMLR